MCVAARAGGLPETARDIMADATAAAGGDVWRLAKTIRLSGSAVLYRDGEATDADRYEMYRVYPRHLDGAHRTTGKFRLDAFQGGRLLFRISYDGEQLYDQSGPMPEPAASELAASSFGFSAARFALGDGFELTRMPDDQVEGRPCYFVQVTDPSGGQTLFAVDRDDSSIRLVGWDTPRGWHHRIYSDFYRLEKSGFRQPGRVRLYYDSIKAADIRWKTARLDVPLEDALFKGPAAAD